LPDLVDSLHVSVPAGKYECIVCGDVFDVRAQARAAVVIRARPGSTAAREITVNGELVHACGPSAVPRCAPWGSVALIGSWLVSEPVCRPDWTLSPHFETEAPDPVGTHRLADRSPRRKSRFTQSAAG
jgi:hypothetical protein